MSLDCGCNLEGCEDHSCDPITGQCRCKCGITGLKCDECMDFHYNFPSCEDNCNIHNLFIYFNISVISILSDCSCSEKGSISLICDKETGQCPCQPNVTGRQCETCQDGFKEYPDCERMYFSHINENLYKNIHFCIQLVIVM